MARILYVITEDWYFLGHYARLAARVREAGHEVAVATRIDAGGERIRALGLRAIPLAMRRKRFGPHRLVGAVAELAGLYRRERADIVHHIALQPVILGGLAARLSGQRRVVSAVTGLGAGFSTPGPGGAAVRAGVRSAVALVARAPGQRFIFQNTDDPARLGARALAGVPVTVVPGAGVDIERFRPSQPPSGAPLSAALVARMIGLKGVAVAVEAARRLHAAGVPFVLRLVGEPDARNVTAIAREQLAAWAEHPAVEWWGRRDDVAAVWAETDIAVLPSLGGEGMPLALLEAAACGRPLVGTDVAGIRDIVRPDETGLLASPGDAGSLAAALGALAADPGLRQRLGQAARRRVEAEFSDTAVAGRVLALYDTMLRHDAC